MDRRIARVLMGVLLGLFVLAEYGCSSPKDSSGNGSGVYYTGPMKPKGGGPAKGGE